MSWSHWMTDLRRAARTLTRSVGFTATAVGMLGLTIGAAAGMYTVVDAVLLEPLPYSQPDRLVYIAASAPGSQLPEEFGVAPEFYVQYREQSRQLEDVTTYNSFTSTLRTADRVERVRMSVPTNTMYSTLGVTPILGRVPVDEDENNVVVISHALWTSWFGRDPSVVGRSVQASGRERTIIGVMGPEFRFPNDDTMLWIASSIDAADLEQTGRFGINLVGRLAPGATPETAANELTGLARRLPERFGGSPGYARTIELHRAVVRPLEEQFLGAVSRPLWVLLGAAAIVLLIACANVANLFLVRTEGRHRELAMRRALGAGRRELMRLQMAEAVVVAAMAGIVAVVLAAVLLPLFLAVAPQGIPRIDQVQLGAGTLLFALAAALLAALICGGVPALRGASPDLARLRDGGRALTTRRHRARDVLVVGQTALALLLLIGSALLLRSALQLQQTDPGYDTQDIFSFQMAPERPELDSAAAFARFNLAFLERLAALPGVQSAGLIENMPLDEGTASMAVRTDEMAGSVDEGTLVNFTYTAGDYFPAMGIDLRAGRSFTDEDHGSALGNVVVSESAARLLWPGKDPIGRRLQREGRSEWETVVGVVEDVLQNGFRERAEPVVYFPMVDATPQGGRPISSPAFVVRTTRADSIAPEVRALVREVAPEAPMYRVYTMEGLVSGSMAQLSFTLLTLGIAAVLSLVLGAVGLYGVLSYIVAERTREIGLRMALGATARQVRRIVVAQGARVVAIGIAVGVLAAVLSTRALGGLLYGVEPVDALTFATMSLAMVAVGMLASYLPARRASNMDPIESLRGD